MRSCSVVLSQKPDKTRKATQRKKPASASAATVTKPGGSCTADAGSRAPIRNSDGHPAEHANVWRWHGGTFAPPPYLQQERVAQDVAEPPAEPTVAQPACTKDSKAKATARRKASPTPTPSNLDDRSAEKPPEEPGPEVPEPSAAAVRLMALRARIRAKEAAGR